MKHRAPNLQRVLAAFAMCGAFVVMASVFVPLPSGADESRFTPAEPLPPRGHSIDPHEGLASMGSFVHQKYYIRVYATEGGPRFSIYDAATGEEIAALMSAAKVTKLFPEIPIDGTDFSAPVQIMMLEPAGQWSSSGR